MNKDIKSIQYIGFGDSLPPIPARDLTRAEIDALRPDEIGWMKQCGLYKFTYETPKPAKKAAAKENKQ